MDREFKANSAGLSDALSDSFREFQVMSIVGREV
jgi:hypothetical protein